MVHVILANDERAAQDFCSKNNLSRMDTVIVRGVHSIEGLRFRYGAVVRLSGWSKRSDIEEIEERILRTHVALTGMQEIRTAEHGVEWDIDANLPMYTRDYLRLQKEGKI